MNRIVDDRNNNQITAIRCSQMLTISLSDVLSKCKLNNNLGEGCLFIRKPKWKFSHQIGPKNGSTLLLEISLQRQSYANEWHRDHCRVFVK